MHPATAAWTAAAAAVAIPFTIVDVHCDRHAPESTWSAATRRIFHTDKPLGRATFLFVVGGTALAYTDHILNPTP